MKSKPAQPKVVGRVYVVALNNGRLSNETYLSAKAAMASFARRGKPIRRDQVLVKRIYSPQGA